MSVHKNSTYVTNLTHPVMPPVRMSHIQANFMRFRDLLSGCLVRGRKEEVRSVLDVTYDLGNERHGGDVIYQVSPQQADLERMIAINWVNLRVKKNY